MARIVVIEDVQDNFDLLADALGDSHELLHAATGAAGFELIERVRPDLVLLDMRLPDTSGWELAGRIKARPDLRATPLVAMTAHAMKGDRERCLESGCDAYLSKPVDFHELAAVIESRAGMGAVHAACDTGEIAG